MTRCPRCAHRPLTDADTVCPSCDLNLVDIRADVFRLMQPTVDVRPRGVLQRALWNGQPKELDDFFRLSKGQKRARCALWSHWAGWELRLLVADELLQSQVCRSEEDVFSTGEGWKAAMIAKGWMPS